MSSLDTALNLWGDFDCREKLSTLFSPFQEGGYYVEVCFGLALISALLTCPDRI